jgi:PAS domain S-box-containing protein
LVNKGKKAENIELDIIHKDGHIVNTEFSTRVIKKDGKNFGYLSLIRDITDQKQVRDKIKETEERYNSLFNRSLL